jgi:CO dehydrogenase maturation factor
MRSRERTTNKHAEKEPLIIRGGTAGMKKLVTIGRGGTGKTSFVALTTKYFVEAGTTPLLLVDADPDQNLGEMVGVDLKEEGKKTISELLVETFLKEGGTTVGVPPTERIENRIWQYGMHEGETFDFISIGTKWVEGCYCLPNAALKGALESVTKNYKYVLIDSPAGLEHLNRRVTSKVDDIFDILDPSKKSFDHVERAFRIAKEVKIEFKNFYVVGGFRFPEDLKKRVETSLKFNFLGKIALDEQVEEYVLAGKSLLELPSNSRAYLSVKRIVDKIA